MSTNHTERDPWAAADHDPLSNAANPDNRGGTITRADNITRAERLRAAAVDQMYTFAPGSRAVVVDGVSDQLTVTGCFTAHSWGYGIALAARNKHDIVQAGAEVSVSDQLGTPCGTIWSRIRHFQAGGLLWTNTAEPLSAAPIRPALQRFLAAAADVVYQLDSDVHTDGPDARIVWTLSAPGRDCDAIQFHNLRAAAAHINAAFTGGRT
jgi:uncharacterized membrane protein